MKAWAWVVGGGAFQLPLIKEFKKRNLKVMVSDKDPSCLGARESDLFIEADTFDVERNAKLAFTFKSNDAAIVAVQTAGTDVGPTVSIIASILGLPSCSPLAAIKAKDKCLMRKSLDLEHPKYLEIESFWDEGVTRANWDSGPCKYPCVVKASDNWASRGMSIVREGRDLYAAVQKARSFNKYSKRVLIEEHLNPGEFEKSSYESATDWLVVNGFPYFINGAERIFSPENPGIELGYINPWNAPEEVRVLAQIAVKGLGVQEGPFKMDVMFSHKYAKWCLLECATRWSGSFDHNKAALIAREKDLTAVLVDYSLDNPLWRAVQYEEEAPKKGFCAVLTPILPEGLIITEDMLFEIESSPGVVNVEVLQKKVPLLQHCASRALWIFCYGKTREEAWYYAEHSLDTWKELERSR